ncbi:MAG: alpha/beta fold hydrolase [Acidobacteriota bacterium]
MDGELFSIELPDGAEIAARFQAGRDRCPWIVFVHGFGSSQEGDKVRSFRSWSQEAGLGFASFDFRGHGESGGSMSELTLTRNLTDLRAVLDALAVRDPKSMQRTILLGSSMGAATAMWLCARQPRRIAASVLIAPAVHAGASFERWAGTEGIAEWKRKGTITFEGEFVTAELDWEFLRDLRTYRMQDLLKLYKTPSLVLQGLEDDTVLASDVLDFVQKTDAEMDCVLYARGDHRLTDEKLRLWTSILDFLSVRGLL